MPAGSSVAFAWRGMLERTAESGHAVTPSEEVDQAWHMHLTCTRSYWERLCRDLLGSPLHHCPTQGGTEESHTYRALSKQTLASYRAAREAAGRLKKPGPHLAELEQLERGPRG